MRRADQDSRNWFFHQNPNSSNLFRQFRNGKDAEPWNILFRKILCKSFCSKKRKKNFLSKYKQKNSEISSIWTRKLFSDHFLFLQIIREEVEIWQFLLLMDDNEATGAFCHKQILA